MFLIGMVARVMRPGCKMDYMPVLEGEQGTFKSSACAILAGDYFSDHLPNLNNKDASLHLRGKWLIEVAELRAYSRAAIDEFKEFLVRDTDRYRPPWGRKDVHEPRQCVFVGTTNKLHYLRDETGNRRSWPARTGAINLDCLRQDRDQLFAEATWRFKHGEAWWPDGEFERTKIVAEQEARFEADVWETPIADYLARLPEGELLRPKRTTVLDIAIYALDFEEERPTSKDEPRGTPINRLGQADQRRITAILTHLGWEPKRDKHERWWQPKPEDR
jgi:predicted P-loop ATPase